MASADQTPANVAAAAAIPDALPLDGVALIGLISDSTGGAALLRNGQGEIERVTTGDSAFGLTVTALDDSQIVLADARGTTHTLQIPG
ncbi:hypothetical protein AB3Y40_09370 [Yoonia sp. R2331]|uniref:hypothetical protein n=1 Tax=Yoonia sp. R2331 TaxID=3237238 RepID=UPI0034E37F44